MELKILKGEFTVCKIKDKEDFDFNESFYFVGKTDEEFSVVCRTEGVPEKTTEREDGWRFFKIVGKLDFSLIGILSDISSVLAENGISIFAVSTFDTDYVGVKKEDLVKAVESLEERGYSVSGQ